MNEDDVTNDGRSTYDYFDTWNQIPKDNSLIPKNIKCNKMNTRQPSSAYSPIKPGKQEQLKLLLSPKRLPAQMPPFLQGLGTHTGSTVQFGYTPG